MWSLCDGFDGCGALTALRQKKRMSAAQGKEEKMDMMNYVENILDYQIGAFRLSRLLSAMLLALVCLLVVKLLLKAADGMFARLQIDPTLLGMLRAIVKTLLLSLAVLIILGYLGIPVTSLVALLSVAGLAVSLSIQNFLNNVTGGIQLLISRPFKVGDYISAGGCEGTVHEIGMFYTKIMTADNKLIQLPNSTVVSANITNYTHEPMRRVSLNVTASYDAPVERVKQSLLASVERTENILSEPEPFARVSGYKDSAIEYLVRVWCRTEDYWNVYYDLLEEIKAGFEQDGVEMNYPYLNVRMPRD